MELRRIKAWQWAFGAFALSVTLVVGVLASSLVYGVDLAPDAKPDFTYNAVQFTRTVAVRAALVTGAIGIVASVVAVVLAIGRRLSR